MKGLQCTIEERDEISAAFGGMQFRFDANVEFVRYVSETYRGSEIYVERGWVGGVYYSAQLWILAVHVASPSATTLPELARRVVELLERHAQSAGLAADKIKGSLQPDSPA